MNYNQKMEDMIQSHLLKKEIPTLLLHCCCAPCSSAVLERLSSFFQITVLYYNPNITLEEEYQKRIKELKRFIKEYPTKYPIKWMEGQYQPELFFEKTKGLENEKEGGKRCFVCYQMRLEETARLAKENHFDYFTTTLSISPHKNVVWLNEIGEKLASDLEIGYLYADFKKKEGYKRSIVLSKEYHLYRQDYCGCSYSKLDKISYGRDAL